MKKLLLLGIILTGCNSTTYTTPGPEFDWMPEPVIWQQNIRDCRSQDYCNAADLFKRT